MAKYEKSKKNVYEPKGHTPTKSVSERGDLGGSKPGMTIGKHKSVKGKPKVKGRGVDDTAVKDKSPRVKTAFEKRQKALRTQAVKDALKPVKPKKKTATELSREFVKEKKEKSALDKQTDSFVAEKEAGRRLPKHLQKQKKVTAKKRTYGGEFPDKKTDIAISKSANVEAPDEKTETVKVPSGTKPGMNIRGGPAARKRKAKLTGTGVDDKAVAPKPPKAISTDRPAQTYPKTTAKVVEPKTNGAAEASKKATAKDAKAETGSAAKMGDRPEGRRKRHVAEDRAAFGISRGGTKEDPSSGYRVNPFGKNKTKAEADKAMSAAYAAEQEDRKKVSRQDHYQYGEGRRSKLKQTAKKGGTIKARKGGAIKRTYNTGGTIRFKSGGAVVDTYDY